MVVMETPEKVLRRLEFKVVRRLDGFLFGDYRGVFYGPSLDLAEVREYQPGDEVRRIDWNVTARMNRLFIRQYLEERELTAWLLVDLSPSMGFGTRRHLKREVAAEFAGVAAYIITRHGDKVGCLAFPGRHLPVIPPRTGRVQALRILQLLQRAAAGEGGLTDLGAALGHAARMLRRRSLVFVVSDFLSRPGWDGPLRDLAGRHDVIAVWVRDPAEEELPDVGLIPIRDPETGQQAWVDTSDRRVRAAYRELVEGQQAQIRETLRRSRVDTLELSTAGTMVDPLVKFITHRRQRGRWRSPGR
ncbi:MAG: DUF58 domain-containing protein [Armatimonadota bacterium]|nr:DUF58 domain-containing protein [Armatimonadota bacterium]MDR7427427.1 DUF58 domain-containing protein [Armatimonadota bacterium]MDR7470749.1 DUF58 domain-containing protein [Armatimonadota bacterium]MDR7475006.1 DUF58 domain-containing protein [Armatimonadota bacterium]MDR7539493.1 DUF58 domain-containing protein [Armatimonadota bacterium]